MFNDMKKVLLSVELQLLEADEKIRLMRAKIKKLTAKGLQEGKIHFKTDRPNTMYILEPSQDGKRKYKHIGTDPKKQEKTTAAVERFVTVKAMTADLDRLTYQQREISYSLNTLERSAKLLLSQTNVVCQDYESI